MKDLFLDNPDWQSLPMRPITLFSKKKPNTPTLERKMGARSVGNRYIRIFQLSTMNKSPFQVEPKCIIKDDSGEYVCMTTVMRGWPRFPIIIARPKHPDDWEIYRKHICGNNPFFQYGGWYRQESELLEIETLIKKNTKPICASVSGRSLQVENLKVFQLDTVLRELRTKHLYLAPGCKITDNTGTYLCLCIMDTIFPQVPIIIAKSL